MRKTRPTGLAERSGAGRPGRARIAPRVAARIAAALLARGWPVVWVVAAAAPGRAMGHEFWLAASSYEAATARPDAPITVTALVGTGFTGEAVPYAAPRVVRWVAAGGAGGATDLAQRTFNGEIEYARLESCDRGGVVLGYESGFRLIGLEAEPFNRYLEAEGLDRVLEERLRDGTIGSPGRERYRRCAKAWIGGSDPSRVARPVGLAMEIVPLSDPSVPSGRPSSPERMSVEFQALFAGRPAPNLLVRAWNRPGGSAPPDSVGPACSARTDARGIARLAITDEGEWLVSVVHMARSSDPAEADWESTWASLTFRRVREGALP